MILPVSKSPATMASTGHKLPTTAAFFPRGQGFNWTCSAYKNSQVLIRFRMTSNGDTAVADGWYVDDVELKDLSTSTSYFADDFESATSMPANITLTAAPATGYTLTGWTGCDSVTAENKCVVALTVSKSVKATFSATGSLPAAATLVSPNGSISTATPAYIWNAVSNSEWYYLLVSDSTGYKISNWYTAARPVAPPGRGLARQRHRWPLRPVRRIGGFRPGIRSATARGANPCHSRSRAGALREQQYWFPRAVPP